VEITFSYRFTMPRPMASEPASAWQHRTGDVSGAQSRGLKQTERLVHSPKLGDRYGIFGSIASANANRACPVDTL
jgi:hypothetical protein